MSGVSLLPGELRLIAETKLAGAPHAEVLLRAAAALEAKGRNMVHMPLLLSLDPKADASLTIPWPMSAEEFRHVVAALRGLHDIYSGMFKEPTDG